MRNTWKQLAEYFFTFHLLEWHLLDYKNAPWKQFCNLIFTFSEENVQDASLSKTFIFNNSVGQFLCNSHSDDYLKTYECISFVYKCACYKRTQPFTVYVCVLQALSSSLYVFSFCALFSPAVWSFMDCFKS